MAFTRWHRPKPRRVSRTVSTRPSVVDGRGRIRALRSIAGTVAVTVDRSQPKYRTRSAARWPVLVQVQQHESDLSEHPDRQACVRAYEL